MSDTPRGAYGDSALWANDIHAVIEQLDLINPLLAGWFYGGVIIADYSVVAGMQKPLLLTWGDKDTAVLPAMREHIAGLARHAKTSIYPGAGHAPFLYAAERFNRELRELREAA